MIRWFPNRRTDTVHKFSKLTVIGNAMKFGGKWTVNTTKQFMMRRGRTTCLHKRWAWVFLSDGA